MSQDLRWWDTPNVIPYLPLQLHRNQFREHTGQGPFPDRLQQSHLLWSLGDRDSRHTPVLHTQKGITTPTSGPYSERLKSKQLHIKAIYITNLRSPCYRRHHNSVSRGWGDSPAWSVKRENTSLCPVFAGKGKSRLKSVADQQWIPITQQSPQMGCGAASSRGLNSTSRERRTERLELCAQLNSDVREAGAKPSGKSRAKNSKNSSHFN